LGRYRNAIPVTPADRPALQEYDHTVRRLCYERDPMNRLAENVFGADKVDEMLRVRIGTDQIARSKTY